MKLAVIGTGYVGLVVGAGFADHGNEVTCVDVDKGRLARLTEGEVPFYEPGLQALVRHNLLEGRLRFCSAAAEAVADCDAVFLAVGTPPLGDGAADTGALLQAAAEVGRALSGYAVVAIKSTAPIGSTERVRDAIAAVTTRPFAVVANPEFLREGSAVQDFLRPMRVVVGVGPTAGPGADDERARAFMRRLYAPILRVSDRLLITDARSAEMIKYASNAYLATRISFMNDIAALCEELGADVDQVRRGMGMDRRIGESHLFPGMGFGGSCLPKDIRALLALARERGVDLPIVAAAAAINERQKTGLLGKMARHFADGGLAGRRIAVWGLSFKPETDDLREAPALALIGGLRAAGASVRASDPAALPGAAALAGPGLELFEDAYEAARGADALVLCTEWRQYRLPDFRRLRGIMAGDGLFDGRNVWDGPALRAAGFRYYGIGRP